MATSAVSGGSMIDVNSIVNGLMKIESLPLTKIQDKIDSTSVSISSMGELRSKVDSVYSKLQAIENPFFLGDKKASVADSTIASVSVSSGVLAKQGSVSVSVTSLATAQRSVISGFNSESTAAAYSGTNTLDITFSAGSLGHAGTISVAVAGQSLSKIRDSINKDATNDGRVVASIVKTCRSITPTVSTTQGTVGTPESATVSPFGALAPGESLTIGGLTFTASRATTAAETAAAFESLSDGDGPPLLTDPSYGSYSGALNGWESHSVTGGSLTFTSTAFGNVTDLEVDANIGGDYALVLTSTVTGEEATFTTKWPSDGYPDSNIAPNGVYWNHPTASNPPPTAFDFDQAATSALATIDGITVVSESNTLTTASAGLSINLLATGNTSIQVTDNSAAIKTALTELATALTDLKKTISTLTKPGSRSEKAGPLAGNSGVLALQNAIDSAYFSGITLGTSGATAGSWSNLGLSLSRDGTVTFNETNFTSYLSTTGSSIYASGFSSQLKTILYTYKGFAGTLERATDTLRTEANNLSDRYSSTEKRLANLRASYIAKYSALDSKLSQLSYTGQSVSTSLNRLNQD